MAENDAIRICSQALVKIGAEPITSFEDGTAEAETARMLYQAAVDARLASHPWHWSKRWAQLVRKAGVTIPSAVGRSAVFSLPADCFRPIGFFVNGQSTADFVLAEGLVYLNAEDADVVEAQYHGRVDETAWSEGFRKAMVDLLAAEFAIPLRDSREMQDAYDIRGERALALARHSNHTEQPTQAMPTGRQAALRAS